MLRRRLAILRLERRRLLLVTLLAFAAGVLLYARLPAESALGLPVPLLTGLIYAAIVGPAAVATMLIMPTLRFLMEGAAISRFVVSLAAFGLPDMAYVLVTTPLLMATVTVSGGMVVSRWFSRASSELINR